MMGAESSGLDGFTNGYNFGSNTGPSTAPTLAIGVHFRAQR